MSNIRVAVVQAAPVAFDREKTLEKVRALTAEAAGKSVRLIVFPEAFVSGYPRGLDFGARVGSRTPEGRELFRRYWESAVDVPGPAEVGAALAALPRGEIVRRESVKSASSAHPYEDPTYWAGFVLVGAPD